MLKAILRAARRASAQWNLPPRARAEAARDREGGLHADPGIAVALAAAVEWLCAAQDNSASNDGGVARDFSLVDGWATSYPETTGYIVPTMIASARHLQRHELRNRARRMTDWLVSIQFPEGGFQGGVIGADIRVPVTFNTGQVLIGLAAALTEFGEAYHDATARAADWLVTTQDADGCWRRHETPFATGGEKTYDTHVAWGLLEADRVLPGRGYGEAALRNVRWALTRQRRNGWFEACDLQDNERPLTHTLGYALRGLLEAYRFSSDDLFLGAAKRTALGCLSAQRLDGSVPGRLDAQFRGTVDWVCLTGNVQLAACWLMLFGITGEPGYRDAGVRANAYVRRTIALDGPAETRGGVKGSFPVDGAYGRFEYLSWAAKYCIDANLLQGSSSPS